MLKKIIGYRTFKINAIIILHVNYTGQVINIYKETHNILKIVANANVCFKMFHRRTNKNITKLLSLFIFLSITTQQTRTLLYIHM